MTGLVSSVVESNRAVALTDVYFDLQSPIPGPKAIPANNNGFCFGVLRDSIHMAVKLPRMAGMMESKVKVGA